MIFESNQVLTKYVCDDIIEKFDEESNQSVYNIPKQDPTWEKIERILYKELLIKINEYKTKLLENMIENDDLILLLNKTLYTRNITIQKVDIGSGIISKYNFIPNRYNVLTYIFYLNDIDNGGEIIFENQKIIPKKGKLVLFQEDIIHPYHCVLPSYESQYIITGQLCYDNII